MNNIRLLNQNDLDSYIELMKFDNAIIYYRFKNILRNMRLKDEKDNVHHCNNDIRHRIFR